MSCNRLPKIITVPLSVRQYGENVSAEVSDLLGPYTLSLSTGQAYRITSWKNGVLVAEPTESRTHDVTLRISITDKTVTRIWQGKGEFSQESLIETLR